MNYDQIIHQLEDARLRAATCKECKKRPDILYEPGATILSCKCYPKFIVIPEFEPIMAAKCWNRCWIAKNFREEYRDLIIEEYNL